MKPQSSAPSKGSSSSKKEAPKKRSGWKNSLTKLGRSLPLLVFDAARDMIFLWLKMKD
jgi:hypothetical protein